MRFSFRSKMNVVFALILVLSMGFTLFVSTQSRSQAAESYIHLKQTSSQTQNTIPTPGWWNGVCDDTNYYNNTIPQTHSQPLGSSYKGLITCGPMSGNGYPDNTIYIPSRPPSDVQVNEWECTELVMRYLYLAYDIPTYQAYGDEIVTHYNSSNGGAPLQRIATNLPGSGIAPQVGDVLSYGTIEPGHTSIVTVSKVKSDGSGYITVIEQNNTPDPTGQENLTVKNWQVMVPPNSGLPAVNGWLHDPASLKPLSSQSGLPNSTVTVSGKGMQPNEPVAINYDGTQLVKTTATSTGAFSKQILVPASSPQGQHVIYASGLSSGYETERAAFEVVFPTFTDFSVVPTSHGRLNFTTKGPDGNVWFTEMNGNEVGNITPGGLVTLFPLPGQANGITTGPDGALWAAGAFRQIYRISVTGSVTTYLLPNNGGGSPQGITVGPDGNLWFTEACYNQNCQDRIGVIDTSGNLLNEFPVPTQQSFPYDIIAGSNGNLWFTENGGNIGRITTSGQITEFHVPTIGSDPNGITLGPDGNIWFTDFVKNNIGKITPSGKITEFLVPGNGQLGNAEITVGPDGSLWFTEELVNEIGRITTKGIITQYQAPSSQNGNAPWDITLGSDGNLWFTDNVSNQIVLIILP